MCGIFGLVAGEGSALAARDFEHLLRQLFLLSESRGKEASGLALVRENRIEIVRKPVPASEMLESGDYLELMRGTLAGAESARGLAAIGHARLVTSGMQGIDANNQPVVKHGLVCVHNGIIVNEAELWQSEPGLAKTSDVDTEVLAALLHRRAAETGSIESAARYAFGRIFGEASVAVVAVSWDVMLVATNTGSLYLAENAALGVTFFASERVIAQRIIRGLPKDVAAGFAEPFQLPAGAARTVCLRSGRPRAEFALGSATQAAAVPQTGTGEPRPARAIVTSADRALESWRRLRRCTRCVLPETMPFIEFDAKGVCNYCRNHQPLQLKGRAALERVLEQYRSRDGTPDCLIAFSGGRDSSYGLHLLKHELGMTPIAYTYDWGMVTDLARRNQARLCGKLGVEHIWVSADIKQKRDNIRKNVEAWLHKPDLGMVPLFMAGDKQFMFHANRIMNDTGIRLMVYANNHFERTDFKVGFCGVRPSEAEIRLNKLSMAKTLQLASYYVRGFLSNPYYLNSSLFDTTSAFLSYYFVNQDFLYLFDYLPWDEEVVNRMLVEHYDWEFAPDTKTSWRIGDGTAPFYNYIYHTVAGFSEYETFRSNQIREGLMTRERALRLIEEENGPRYHSILEYCRMIRVDFDMAMRVIDSIPRRYGPIRKATARDFTLAAYRDLAGEMMHSGLTILGVLDWHRTRPTTGILLRHDVDRRPRNAVAMARLEASLGLRTSYYFRVIGESFDPEAIAEIRDLGHEIGYHYEDLALAGGDVAKARGLFGRHLERLRQLAPIRTIAMHGSPLTRFNNLDMWRQRGFDEFGIEADAFLTIDYSDAYYLTDTGRGWNADAANFYDLPPVALVPPAEVRSTLDLRRWIARGNPVRIAINAHPERWDEDPVDWTVQWGKDRAANVVKRLLSAAGMRSWASPSGRTP